MRSSPCGARVIRTRQHHSGQPRIHAYDATTQVRLQIASDAAVGSDGYLDKICIKKVLCLERAQTGNSIPSRPSPLLRAQDKGLRSLARQQVQAQ